MNVRIVLALIMILLGCGRCARAELPKVEVTQVRRVFHNGQHNAFTDLVKFGNKYFLTFRSCPDGHMVHPTASVIVLASDNLSDWQQVHRFSVKDRDTRDPHFLVYQDKLFVYTGTWYSGPTTIPPAEYDLNKHLGYAAWTSDGQLWHSPILLEGTFGHYVWRAATDGKKAYLCGRRKIEFEEGPRGEGYQVQSMMLESEDGLVFRKSAVFQEIDGDETAFLFEPSGDLLAIGRRGRGTAQLIAGRAPYHNLERRDLDRHVGGPLLVKWGEHYVVGGRHSTTDRGPKTSMCWLDQGKLVEFAELPSGGDNSYPGFLDLGNGRAVMSYYSSHELIDGQPITAIYMAELRRL